MNKNKPTVGNVGNGAVWYTIVFQVSTFTFFVKNLMTRDRWSFHGSFPIANIVCFENPKLNPNNQYS